MNSQVEKISIEDEKEIEELGRRIRWWIEYGIGRKIELFGFDKLYRELINKFNEINWSLHETSRDGKVDPNAANAAFEPIREKSDEFLTEVEKFEQNHRPLMSVRNESSLAINYMYYEVINLGFYTPTPIREHVRDNIRQYYAGSSSDG